MREILFRGKKICDSKWVIGNYNAPLPTNWGATIEDAINIPNLAYSVDPDTVGQYTGLTDKNGKQIFEGDIIKAKIEGGNHEGFTWPNMRVEFEQGAFCLVYGEHNRLCNFNGLAPSVSLEVIGNIHDNPNLLETEEK